MNGRQSSKSAVDNRAIWPYLNRTRIPPSMKDRLMYIQTEDTPNPQSMKFVPGVEILGASTLGMDFPAASAAQASPLAMALFEVDGVQSVFLGPDFVTVTKQDRVQWNHVKPVILGALADHLTARLPILTNNDGGHAAGATPLDEYDPDDRAIVEQIIELIETRVRPAVAADGGDIVFRHFEPKTGVVFLSLHGACSGCPSSSLTLKSGIENMLKHYVPEVSKVEAAL